MFCVFFQAEDGIRDLVRSRGRGDVYKRQATIPVGPVWVTGGNINSSVKMGMFIFTVQLLCKVKKHCIKLIKKTGKKTPGIRLK